MKDKKVILIGLGVILIVLIGLFIGLLFNNNQKVDVDKESSNNNLPSEINDVYKIVNNVNLYGFEKNEAYDYRILNDENKHMMLFNYLNLKELLNEELTVDKIDNASVELFGEKIDYGNLLIAYDKYVYQRDQDKIYRNKLEYAPTYSFAVDVVDYEVKGNNIILNIKISGVSTVDKSTSNKYQYKFLKNDSNYKLISISLMNVDEVYNVKDESEISAEKELINNENKVSDMDEITSTEDIETLPE